MAGSIAGRCSLSSLIVLRGRQNPVKPGLNKTMVLILPALNLFNSSIHRPAGLQVAVVPALKPVMGVKPGKSNVANMDFLGILTQFFLLSFFLINIFFSHDMMCNERHKMLLRHHHRDALDAVGSALDFKAPLVRQLHDEVACPLRQGRARQLREGRGQRALDHRRDADGEVGLQHGIFFV